MLDKLLKLLVLPNYKINSTVNELSEEITFLLHNRDDLIRNKALFKDKCGWILNGIDGEIISKELYQLVLTKLHSCLAVKGITMVYGIKNIYFIRIK